MNTRDIPIVDRMRRTDGMALSIPHMQRMAKVVAEKLNIPLPGYQDRYNLANFITNMSNDEINHIHYQIVDYYKSTGQGRAFKRGRSFGAKNKNNNSDRDYSKGEEIAIEGIDELTKHDEVKQLPAPVSADMSNYVTKPVFERFGDMVAQTFKQNDYDINILRGCNDHQAKKLEELTERVDNIKLNTPTIIEIKRNDLPAIEMGIQHRNFPMLLKMCNASMRSGSHLNVWIYGPKGSGKTSAAENVCKALFGSLERYHYNGALATAFQLTGFMDANGKYVSTPFRDAWENGGVYLFDEIDGSMPDALLALNGALANGVASFPDKMVPRHKDCIIIAGANTTGLGGTTEYVGRFKQDAALTDRFCYLDWPHDDALEDALCGNKDWLKIVRETRTNCQRIKYKGQIPSMRASLYGEALLAADVDLEYTINATMRKGVADQDWQQIKPKIKEIAW